MTPTMTYLFPGISSGHAAPRSKPRSCGPGVEAVEVDLATTRVAVAGTDLDDAAI